MGDLNNAVPELTANPEACQSGTQSIGSPHTSERRRGTRYPAYVVAKVCADPDHDRRECIGLTQNIGAQGALLLVQSNVKAGERLELELHVGGAGERARRVCGRVVRSLAQPFDRGRPWMAQVAVEFDEELSGLDDELSNLANRQSTRIRCG